MRSFLSTWRGLANTYEDLLEVVQFILSLQLGFAILWRLTTLIVTGFNLNNLQAILFQDSPVLRFSYLIYTLVSLGTYFGGVIYLNHTQYKRGWLYYVLISLILGSAFLIYVNLFSINLWVLEAPYDIINLNGILHRMILFSFMNLIIFFIITVPFIDSTRGEGYAEPLSDDVPSYWKDTKK